MLKEVEMPQAVHLGVVDLVFARSLGVSKAATGTKSTWMVSRRCPASKSTVSTNQGAVIPRAAANNWLVITPAIRQLANPSSQGGRAAASTVAALSLWICGRRADTAEEGLPTAPPPNSTGSATTINLPINELYPLKFQKRHTFVDFEIIHAGR